MRVLVTGGAGFIGSNFVRYMLREHPGYGYVVLDKLTYAGNLENLEGLEGLPNYRFVHGDICDADSVGDAMHSADAVVHFAAETHVDRSITEAGSFVETDVYGTFVLLEAARSKGIRRFVHISTDEVYGDCGERPSREDDPLMPRSPYAASKTGADRLAFSYYCTYDVPVVITRCSSPTLWRTRRCPSTGTERTLATGFTSRTTAEPSTWSSTPRASRERSSTSGPTRSATSSRSPPSSSRPWASPRSSSSTSTTASATFDATPSTPRRSASASAGSRRTASVRPLSAPSVGTSRTRAGGSASRAASSGNTTTACMAPLERPGRDRVHSARPDGSCRASRRADH